MARAVFDDGRPSRGRPDPADLLDALRCPDPDCRPRRGRVDHEGVASEIVGTEDGDREEEDVEEDAPEHHFPFRSLPKVMASRALRAVTPSPLAALATME